MFSFYRHKPFLVKAVQVTDKNYGDVQGWINPGWEVNPHHPCVSILVRESSEWIYAFPGDYIIKVDDKFSVMNEEDFARRYEETL